MKKPSIKMGRKVKGKRWKKGHSSSSNPEKSTHRQLAKNRFFQPSAGRPGITKSDLEKHDAAMDEGSNGSAASDDQLTSGGKTATSWASAWTDCSNTTFSRVLRYSPDHSIQHREILAVLAAVTEVIKSQGGVESETEYFATASTTEDKDSLGAVIYLLSLVMKKVPPAVLKSKFGEVSKVLSELLLANLEQGQATLLRSLLSCMAVLLRAQDLHCWTLASTQHILTSILRCVTHPKPKVRKASHSAVCSILRGSEFMVFPANPSMIHPGANLAAKYLVQLLEQGVGLEALYAVELLKSVLPTLPAAGIKSSLETLLRAMATTDQMLKSHCLKAIEALFEDHPTASALPAALNAQLSTALYDYQPVQHDAVLLSNWVLAQKAALLHMASVDERLALSHFPRFFACCMKILQSDNEVVTRAAAESLQALINEPLAEMSEMVAQMMKGVLPGATTPVHKIMRTLESGLGYQYHLSWKPILEILQSLFLTLGASLWPTCSDCLVSLANLRANEGFQHISQLDKTFGSAIKTIGPRNVLEAVPLLITGNSDDQTFPRSWLLPVLRDNVQNTELKFFTEYFLPLAAKLRALAQEHASNGRQVEAKTYDTIQSQIWSLLPGFCTQPTDLSTSFRGIAKVLGSMLQERADLRMTVLTSLRKIIKGCADNYKDRLEVGRFAKNFVPLLLNLFTANPENEKDKERLAVLETTAVYLQVCEKGLVSTFFQKAFEKLIKEDTTGFKRHALLDVFVAMVNYLSGNDLETVYKYAVDNLQDTDRTAQKKCYRLLETICSSVSEDALRLVSTDLDNLQSLLLSALSTSSPQAKAPRLRCLACVIQRLEKPKQDFVAAVLPEAILCTREAGGRARNAAKDLVLEMSDAVERWHGDDPDAGRRWFLQLLLAGLAGSVVMIDCTLRALASVLLHIRDRIPHDVPAAIMQYIKVLLVSRSREVVASTVALTKVYISVISDTQLAPHLNPLVSSLVSMKEDARHHFRFKAKELFLRLARKFGYDTLQSMTPEVYHKMLKNAQKTQNRMKRRKKELAEGDLDDIDEEDENGPERTESIEDILRDTDSEIDEADDKMSKLTVKPKVKAKMKKSYLKEGGEDQDVTDLLDKEASKQVLATKPKNKPQAKTENGGFKMAPDGRLIITEGDSGDEEETQKAGKQKRKHVEDDDDSDDLGELLDALVGQEKGSRKRKLSVDEDDSASQASYRPGGSGIHRPLGKKMAKSGVAASSTSGEKYRSRKAGGDVKRKGAPDPYAYIPLDFKNLNKRKRAKAQGRFNSVVKGARKGSAKGAKQAAKKHKQ